MLGSSTLHRETAGFSDLLPAVWLIRESCYSKLAEAAAGIIEGRRKLRLIQ